MNRPLEILKNTKVVAVLGASLDTRRSSSRVAKYLMSKGFVVYPINPANAGKKLAGREFLGSLSDIPEPIDLVDVFRRSEAIPGMVDEIIKIKPKAVWFQLGISSPESEARLREAGIEVVSNECVFEVFSGRKHA